MPRPPSRLLVPAVVLIALVFLPALASALPPGPALLSAAERPEAGSGLLSTIWGLLSVLWDETGSVLEPDGGRSGPTSGSGAEPSAADTGDTGSVLEPDGRP